ncbi:Vacuolar protein sorting-associated protein 17 [Microbotryomycetes sp. JL221]|nr:Vacuolar protein sorting-associated protein 17 [Microbotryomycetes sp. JL221]
MSYQDPLGYSDGAGSGRRAPSTSVINATATAPSSTASSPPINVAGARVRSISPMSPRPPLPGITQPSSVQTTYRQQQRLPSSPPQHDVWGPVSPDHHRPFAGTQPTAYHTRSHMEPRGPLSDEFDNGSRRMPQNGRKFDSDDDGSNDVASAATVHGQANKQLSQEPPYLKIRIVGLEKNRRDVHIKFNADTNLPSYRQSTYRSVSRSYTEFARFVEAISVTCPQSIIPALPLSQTSAATDDEDDRLVKLAFQKWFARVASDLALARDEETRSFVESDFGYTPHNKRKTSSGFHFSRTSKLPGERDDELTVAKIAMSRLEVQFEELAKAAERASISRRKAAHAQKDAADQLDALATIEFYAPLATGIRKLARTLKVLSDAINEQVSLSDPMAYQSMNARSAKDTLSSRDHVVEEHRTAVKTTIAKRKAIEKIKASGNIRPEKVDEALDELEDARKHETLLAQRLLAISSNLQPSLQSHSRSTHYDVMTALLDHARTNLLAEKQVLKEIELARPEIHGIQKPVQSVVYHSPSNGRAAMSQPKHSNGARKSEIDPSTMARSASLASNMSSDDTHTPGVQYAQNPLGGDRVTQSMFIDRPSPVHEPSGAVPGFLPRSPSSMGSKPEKRSVRSMASSVVVTNDQRQKVDARTAASLLANGF